MSLESKIWLAMYILYLDNSLSNNINHYFILQNALTHEGYNGLLGLNPV
jgi:hypothetical protein